MLAGPRIGDGRNVVRGPRTWMWTWLGQLSIHPASCEFSCMSRRWAGRFCRLPSIVSLQLSIVSFSHSANLPICHPANLAARSSHIPSLHNGMSLCFEIVWVVFNWIILTWIVVWVSESVVILLLFCSNPCCFLGIFIEASLYCMSWRLQFC